MKRTLLSITKKNSGQLKGVAILSVLISVALLMAVVTDLSTKSFVRYKQALNDRDSLRAEALAQSGANFSQLILAIQEPIQEQIVKLLEAGISLPENTLWQMFPIDSDLLKGISQGTFIPGLGLSGTNKDDKPAEKAEEKPKLVGAYVTPEGGYGGFEGSFKSIITDEESLISIKDWPKLQGPRAKAIADQLIKILERPENTSLFDGTTGDTKGVTARQLVANIYDYSSPSDGGVDIDASAELFGKSSKGLKITNYNGMPEGIKPKNAPRDCLSELRLVPGMTDALYQELAKVISVYGEGEKINILSASDELMQTVFYSCAANRSSGQFEMAQTDKVLLQEWRKKRASGEAVFSVKGITDHLAQNGVPVDEETCSGMIGNSSKNFTIRTTATVGSVTRTLIVRLRSSGGIGLQLHQYQYL